MEDVLGSPALIHPTRIMVIEPTNDSDSCSPSAQSMRHKEGMAREGVAMKGIGFQKGINALPGHFADCVWTILQ